MARPFSDIKTIVIRTEGLKKAWIVELAYKNDKMATWSIDRGDLSDMAMFSEVINTIVLQLKSKNSKHHGGK